MIHVNLNTSILFAYPAGRINTVSYKKGFKLCNFQQRTRQNIIVTFLEDGAKRGDTLFNLATR